MNIGNAIFGVNFNTPSPQVGSIMPAQHTLDVKGDGYFTMTSTQGHFFMIPTAAQPTLSRSHQR